MPTLTIDPDRMSDRELTDLATELWKRLAARGNGVPALVIPGADGRPAGYVIPATAAPKIPDADTDFIAETYRRIDNPPDRYLSVDEFLDSLDEYWSEA